jgi:hypothetical protein
MPSTIRLRRVVRDRADRRAGRRTRRHPARGLLSRLAGIAGPAGEAGRSRDPGWGVTAKERSSLSTWQDENPAPLLSRGGVGRRPGVVWCSSRNSKPIGKW